MKLSIIFWATFALFACDNSMQAGEPDAAEHPTSAEVKDAERDDAPGGAPSGAVNVPAKFENVAAEDAAERESPNASVTAPSNEPAAPVSSTPGVKRIFVSRAVFTGDITVQTRMNDAIAGGDMLCNRIAHGAGLGGRWMVWLSTSKVSAFNRVPDDGGPWHAVGAAGAPGSKIFNNKNQFISGPLVPFATDEFGTAVREGTSAVWTGTSSAGHVGTDHCQDFTLAAASNGSSMLMGTYGVIDRLGSAWTNYGTSSCYLSHHLYCLEL